MKFHKANFKPHIKLRVFATIIDYSIFTFFCCVIFYAFGERTDNGWTMNGAPVLLIPTAWFLYFVVTESINQATPGHDIVKLKVVKSDCTKIGLRDAFKRRICDPIDIGIYGIPALIAVSKSVKHQRLGDMLADTIVIKSSDIVETEVTF
jgi:uncharacterized RDD family membrane protein YckC